MREEWRAVPGFDRYQISNLGNVKGVYGRLLKPQINIKDGRRQVQLCPGKINKYIAHLVAEAFLGNRPLGLEVDHVNRIKVDDRASNLRWVTHSENNLNKSNRRRNVTI